MTNSGPTLNEVLGALRGFTAAELQSVIDWAAQGLQNKAEAT